MRIFLIPIFLLALFSAHGQDEPKEISTIDFVQILDNQQARAYHYYKNNWTKLREMALDKGYISSYQWIETTYSEEAPFHFIFITSYPDQAAYDNREANFKVIMEGRTRDLLDDRQPSEFRKSVFTKEAARVIRRD